MRVLVISIALASLVVAVPSVASDPDIPFDPFDVGYPSVLGFTSGDSANIALTAFSLPVGKQYDVNSLYLAGSVDVAWIVQVDSSTELITKAAKATPAETFAVGGLTDMTRYDFSGQGITAGSWPGTYLQLLLGDGQLQTNIYPQAAAGHG